MTLKTGPLPELESKKVVSEIVGFIRRFTFNSRSMCILGLSGGVDSATTSYLLVEALGKDNVRGIILPYSKSDDQSMDDALLVINELGIQYNIIDISPCIDSYFGQFPEAKRFRKGNKMARERMSTLYDMASLYKGLVVGTGNKSELLLGYFTKYGDGGVDIEPLGAIYKTYVYELANYLGVPERIIKKAPTADLWPGQRDEDELGIEYKLADQILYFMIDKGMDKESIIKLGFSKESVIKIAELVKNSEHKRVLPPVPDLHLMFS